MHNIGDTVYYCVRTMNDIKTVNSTRVGKSCVIKAPNDYTPTNRYLVEFYDLTRLSIPAEDLITESEYHSLIHNQLKVGDEVTAVLLNRLLPHVPITQIGKEFIVVDVVGDSCTIVLKNHNSNLYRQLVVNRRNLERKISCDDSLRGTGRTERMLREVWKEVTAATKNDEKTFIFVLGHNQQHVKSLLKRFIDLQGTQPAECFNTIKICCNDVIINKNINVVFTNPFAIIVEKYIGRIINKVKVFFDHHAFSMHYSQCMRVQNVLLAAARPEFKKSYVVTLRLENEPSTIFNNVTSWKTNRDLDSMEIEYILNGKKMISGYKIDDIKNYHIHESD